MDLPINNQLDESTFIFKGFRSVIINFCLIFFNEIPLSKKNSPRWDATFCGSHLGLYSLPMSPMTLNKMHSIKGSFRFTKTRYKANKIVISSDKFNIYTEVNRGSL